jgi:Ni/Co efflux regulator RcnB
MILSTTYFAVDFFDDPCNQRGMKSEREFRERERERERDRQTDRERKRQREREREREGEVFPVFRK